MKIIQISLLASLCLNLILVGSLAAGAWKGHKMRPQSGPMGEIGMIMSVAPRHLRGELGSSFRSIIRGRDRNHSLGDELSKVLTETPFKAERMAQLLEVNREQNSMLAKQAHESLVQAIANLSEEERFKLGQDIKSHWKRSHNSRHR